MIELIVGLDMRTPHFMGGGIGRYHALLFEKLLAEGMEVVPLFEKQEVSRGRIQKIYNFLYRKSKAKKQQAFDIFHTSYFDMPFGERTINIITVHDLAYFFLPDIMPFIERRYLIYMAKRSIDKCNMVIAVSEKTKEDIISHLGISEDKIHVVYHGSDHLEEDEEDECTSRSGILFVGTIEPRKNIHRLLDAYKHAFLNKGVKDKLIIVGKNGYRATEIIGKINRDKILRRNVAVKGYVEDRQLIKEYKNAKLLVMPSLYEGFGVPVIEAMRFGCPVIASSHGSLMEVGGDAAKYIDPYSVEDISDKIAMVINDVGILEEMAEKGKKRAEKFRWEETARKTIELYKKALRDE